MRTAHRLWVVTAVLLLAACNPVEFDPQVSYPGFEQGLVRYSGPSVAWLDAGVSGTAGHVVYAMALVRNEHLTGPRDRLCIGGGDAIVPCIDTGVDVRQPSQRLRPAFPIEMFSCSRLPTWPMVAQHSMRTFRSSQEGRRRRA